MNKAFVKYTHAHICLSVFGNTSNFFRYWRHNISKQMSLEKQFRYTKEDIPDKSVLLCGKEQELQLDQEQDQLAEVLTEQKQQSFPSQISLGK